MLADRIRDLGVEVKSFRCGIPREWIEVARFFGKNYEILADFLPRLAEAVVRDRKIGKCKAFLPEKGDANKLAPVLEMMIDVMLSMRIRATFDASRNVFLMRDIPKCSICFFQGIWLEYYVAQELEAIGNRLPVPMEIVVGATLKRSIHDGTRRAWARIIEVDILCCVDDCIFAIECKTGKSRIKNELKKKMDVLPGNQVCWLAVTPSCMPKGEKLVKRKNYHVLSIANVSRCTLSKWLTKCSSLLCSV